MDIDILVTDRCPDCGRFISNWRCVHCSDLWSLEDLAALVWWLDLCETCGKPLYKRNQRRFCSMDCRKLRGAKVCDHCGREFIGQRKNDHQYCGTDCAKADRRYRGADLPGTFQPGHERNPRSDISYQCDLPGCEVYFTLKLWQYRQKRQNGQKHIFCCREHFSEFQRRYRRKNHVKVNGRKSVYQSRVARGVCPGCEGKPLEDHVFCGRCNERNNELAKVKNKAVRQRRLDAGQCPSCGGTPREGMTLCQSCNDRGTRRNRELRRRRREQELCAECGVRSDTYRCADCNGKKRRRRR